MGLGIYPLNNPDTLVLEFESEDILNNVFLLSYPVCFTLLQNPGKGLYMLRWKFSLKRVEKKSLKIMILFH